MSYHSRSAEDALQELGSDEKNGLSGARVAQLQAQYGPNKLDEKKKKPLNLEMKVKNTILKEHIIWKI